MSDTPIYDALRRELFNARLRETTARVGETITAAALSMQQMHARLLRPTLEAAKYSTEVHELSRSTGWPLVECEAILTATARWERKATDTPAFDAIRASIPTNKHYPTSSPSWARKRSR